MLRSLALVWKVMKSINESGLRTLLSDRNTGDILSISELTGPQKHMIRRLCHVLCHHPKTVC